MGLIVLRQFQPGNCDQKLLGEGNWTWALRYVEKLAGWILYGIKGTIIHISSMAVFKTKLRQSLEWFKKEFKK